ncbi:MAG: DUF4982 domain-containing protein [Draconibacterium sp.]|nr:DUF4982 domain-containing protein [Draconibacterium sp.]
MKTKPVTIFLFVISSFLLFNCTQTQKQDPNEAPRQKILFDFDWKFHRGDIENGQLPDLNDVNWRNIDVPHDWSIEDIQGTNSPLDSNAVGGISNGYFVGGTGWYRKSFDVPKGFSGKKLVVEFEGVYMNADVWLNGVHLGNHPYGYTAFEFDISNLVKIGETNYLAVQVKNEGRNSRWYSGSGIYRHVWLKITEPVHVKTWGVFITTPEISAELATVEISTQIEDGREKKTALQITTQIFEANGNEVAITKNKSEVLAENSLPIKQLFQIESPKLWSPESPNLYTAIIEIQNEKGEIVDVVEEIFGIRSIEFSIEKGFLLNGKPTLLKGGCMHHGNGPLGAAAFDRAEERRVEIMKANGFNAIRCAHNPPSEAFLDACDRLGIRVIDETFDMWRKPKNPQDYNLYFDDWWQKDVDAMVLRDRNHPSIIMWSVGNEIPERGSPEGAETSKMMVEYIKELDSTRSVTAAVNGLAPDKDPYFATLDISGYNYSFGGDHGQKSIFEKDHERVPDRIMYCAESYPLEAFGAWMDVVNYPYVLGDFVWTSFDYLGEASIGWRGYPHDENYYPWNHAFCGDIDICGFKRPQSYYRDVLWEVGDKLSIFVKPPVPSFPEKENRASWSKWHWHDLVAEWNWEGFENQPLEVNVYSGYEKVELFLNGISLGVKDANLENEYIAKWSVPYQSGELKAMATNKNGETFTNVLKTANTPVKILLTAGRSELNPNGQDLSYIVVDLVDANGLLHPKTENLVQFEIEGSGKIIAVANSNPMSIESFQQPKRKAYKGRCLVIVKSGKEVSEMSLVAKSEGLKSAELKINIKN